MGRRSGKLLTNCLSVLDHFLGFALKELIFNKVHLTKVSLTSMFLYSVAIAAEY